MPKGERPIEILTYANFHDVELDFPYFIGSLEEEMERNRGFSPDEKRERAILVSVSTKPKYEQEDSVEELKRARAFKQYSRAGSGHTEAERN